VIFSAAYALWLYRRVIFGKLEKPSLAGILDLTPREISILAPLVILTLLFGIYPKPLMDPTAVSVNKLIADYNKDLAMAAEKRTANVVIEKSPSLLQRSQQGDFSIKNHTRTLGLLVSLENPKFATEQAAERGELRIRNTRPR
jgi:hypothetical protein